MSNVLLRSGLVACVMLSFALLTPAQPTKAPSAEEIKALQTKYRAERDKVIKDGVAQRVLPAIMAKAEELAKKSGAALAGGRFMQAQEAIRQARWQLPYHPSSVPDYVSRVIGNLRLRHARAINVVAFSHDGLKLATASNDKTVKIWDLSNGHEILTYEGHKADVKCLAWSPDGKFIASVGEEKVIKLWNAETGKDEQAIAAVGDSIRAIAISKDGKHVFTGQHGRMPALVNGIFVYEAKTGKLVREVRDFQARISSMTLNAEGNILATGDEDSSIRLFQYPSFVDNVNQPAYWTDQPRTGAVYQVGFSPDDKTLFRVGGLGVQLFTTPLPGAPFQVGAARLTIPANGPRCAAFSRDAKMIFTGDFQGSIQFWDPENAQKIGEFKNAHGHAVHSLAFTPQGNRLASCSGDFIVRLWDFDITLQSRDIEGHDAPIWTAAFNADATKIVSASADRTVKIWERGTGKVLVNFAEHTAPVTVAQFSPDGKVVASAGGDKVVRIFDAMTGQSLRTCEGHVSTITYLDFSSDSKKIVTGSADRRIIIWDADKGKELIRINDNPSIVAAVAFSPNGKQIAVGNIDQTIRLYDAETGKLQHSWNAHGTAVSGVAYSPNGLMLASCGADQAVAVWPLNTPGANAIRLVGHTGPVSTVAFRMDNIHLVSAGADQLVKLWKIEGNGGKEVQTFRGHKDWVTAAAFSKDGFHVVSSSVDRHVKLWEITSRELPLVAEHASAVQAVAVSPDGTLIATGSSDRSIKLWDRKTGVEVATLTGHTHAVMFMLFTPDGKRLISLSGNPKANDRGDAEIRFWEINPPREIVRSQQQLNVFGKGRLRTFSSFMATDPAGKQLYIWYHFNDASTSTIVDGFDIETGAPVWDKDGRPTFVETTRKINSLAIAANGKIGVTGGRDGSVRLWDLSLTEAKPAPGGDWFLFNKVGVADLGFTPDGSILVATSEVGDIKIAKVQGREVLKEFKGHKSGIAACIVSPDGKTFATVDGDNVIKAWSIDGKELRSWNCGRHQDMFIINFAFTNDSKQIVTANANTTVYVLDLP